MGLLILFLAVLVGGALSHGSDALGARQQRLRSIQAIALELKMSC